MKTDTKRSVVAIFELRKEKDGLQKILIYFFLSSFFLDQNRKNDILIVCCILLLNLNLSGFYILWGRGK
jgi:hypothetical protein